MQCPRCQHDNLPTAKFCQECATPLARPCPNCGSQLPPSAKFCPECAHPAGGVATSQARFSAPESYTPKHLAERILTSKSALEGERKQVTVLFADLQGSMELLADRDPEEARRLLDPVLERMMEAVHRYEGTVNQVMGDGIMALFGAPVAHEDHAVRACYAALRMQETVTRYADEVQRSQGVPVTIRVGLNSGEVVVRAIGSDLHMDYTAVGQTTHLAARMEQMAKPGSVLATADTLRFAEGFVAVKALGPVPVKGLADAVEVYEVTGAGAARTRLQSAVRRGLTRFVGRDAELEQLRRAQQLANDGHGQVAAVVGEAGVGKSRLVYEFTHSHRIQGWLVLEAASVSYGKATSYLPVIDLLKGYFKIQDRDDLREIRAKVTGTVLTLDEALKPTLPALLALLDVPVDDAAWKALDPGQRRQLTIDGVKRLLLRESEVQPLVVVFEDLHWIDGETQALLDSLIESLPTARLLLFVNYRPEYRHGWGGKTYYRQLRIDPLAPESADELLDALLGTDVALGPFKQLLIERTEANPLFLEESVRALVETAALLGERGAYRLTRPIEQLAIPTTVQAILAARIDRLAPEAKRLLQAAAVIGKDVPLPLLLTIADAPELEARACLAHLQAAELLYETRLFPDLEYTFKHALTHEVTYGGLLHERRRELHARVVGAIETLHRDRLGGEIERLADHALRGELLEKAVHYLRQAGGKAAARSALQDARAWFEQALSVLAVLPESQSTLEQAFEIRLDLRPVLTLLAEVRQALQRLREAEALAERLNDDGKRGRVYAFMTNTHAILGELDEARLCGTRALTIARVTGDLELRILTTSLLERLHYSRGEYERVIELATDNLAALPADRVYEYFGNLAPVSVHDRVWLVMSLAQLGRFAEAAEYEAEALRLAEPTHHAFTVAFADSAAGTLHLLKGNWAKARSMIDHGIAVIQSGNVVLLQPVVTSSAWVLAQLGEAGEAQNRLREGEQLLERQVASGIVGTRGWNYHSLGRTCLLLGRLDEARRLGDRALESSQHQLGFAAHARHLLGDIATHPDRFDAERGETHYREALALAGKLGMRPLVAHCHLGLGKLYRRTGKRDQAQEHLATATAMYREMDMRFYLEQVETEMASDRPIVGQTDGP
jgi:class 3 adenylate cyclase/tetratricopeptide (TPR) repeat protein